MGTETYPKSKGNLKAGMQKAGPNIRTPAKPEYQQVNGGTQGYPNTNGSESMSYDKGNYQQKPSFTRTSDMDLKNHGFTSGPSGKGDFKKGSRKGFGSEKPGPDIRAGKPGAAYGY